MANISVTVQDGNNITLVSTPTATQVITIDRGIAGPPGPAGVPGGSTTQVQYNLASAFAGSPNFTFNGSNLVLQSASASDAFRITQTGAGNALVVEDSVNPDTTPFIIDNAGRVIVGYTTRFAPDVNAPTIFPQVSVFGVTATAQYSAFSYINAAANAPVVSLSKSRGATIGTNTIVASGDTIGIVKFTAADGTAFVPAASISAQVDGTPGLNDMPGRLVFSTTADGAATSTERMRIDSIGNVGIGTITPNSELHIAKNDATSYDGAATDGQLAAGSTVFIQQTAGTNTGVAQIVFQPRSTFPYNRIVSSGGSAPFMTFITNNAERLRIDSAGAITLSGGTANGVAYLDGTKVLTTGAALTFDGTRLGIGKTPTTTAGRAQKVQIKQSDAVYSGLQIEKADDDSFLGIGYWSTTSAFTLNSTYGTTGSYLPIAFAINGFEQMRLTSTGLGIGTSSPAKKFDVAGTYRAQIDPSNSSFFGATLTLAGDNGTNQSGARIVGGFDSSFGMLFQTSTAGQAGLSSDPSLLTYTTKMKIDSAGNLGLGVTPSNAYASAKSFEGTSGQVSFNGSSILNLTQNAYYNAAGAFLYKNTAAATLCQQTGGAFYFYNAPSGTAGAAITFTQAMTLHASGGLSLGNTTDPGIGTLNVNGITVGRGAGAVATNTVVGNGALAAANGGVALDAFGQGALGAGPSGNYNAAFGRSSGAAITSGSYNTAIGSAALSANTTASNNTAVGYQAAYLSTGGEVTALGYAALKSNTTGIAHTAVGLGALFTNTTGDQNTGLGYASLYLNTTGSYNVAVGLSALRSNTTASNNTAVGYQAGYSNINGSDLVAVGRRAGYSSVDSNNTFVGAVAGTSTTATNVTALGYASLYTNSSGASNTALGSQALYSNTTASNNTAVGYQAGYSTTTGSGYNTLIGQAAGYTLTTGSNNVLVGTYAGGGMTTGSLNTFVGSVAAGYGAGYFVTTGSRNTIIGAYNGNQGGLDIRTANNYIVLSDGDGNPRGIFDGSGNFLVGPVNLLASTVGAVIQPTGFMANHVAASTNATTCYDLYSTTAAAYRFYVGLAGTIYATSTTITAISDRRLKENIRDLDEGLDVVMALKPRKFDWKEGKGQDIKNARGFIAQEFETVLPDMIEEWRDPAPDGEEAYKAINANLIPTLVKAIQEQQALILSLTTRLTALEAK